MKQGKMNTIDRLRSATVPFALLAMWATSSAHLALAQQPAQPTFSSAAEASQSLFEAVQQNNAQTIANIVGGPTDLASSHDDAQDKLDRELFVRKYQEMHRLHREGDGSVTLYIGAENWPFPVPLIEKNGAWHFDPDSGQKEILYRRVGENELAAIARCHGFAAAAKHDRTKANTPNPENDSATRVAAKAAGEPSGGNPALYHGYYFREVPVRQNRTGASALIAYPAEYGSSGVMTFIVTDSVIVYEKDLGANTSALAGAMASFRKDGTWHSVVE